MSDFKAKMHQIRFRLELRPRPHWGSLQRSPDSLAGFQGPTSKGGEGKGEGVRIERGGEGKEEKGEEERGGEGGEGREAEAFLVIWPRRLSALNPPLVRSLLISGPTVSPPNSHNRVACGGRSTSCSGEAQLHRRLISTPLSYTVTLVIRVTVHESRSYVR